MKENIQSEEIIRRQWWKQYNEIKESYPNENNLTLVWDKWNCINRSGLLKEFSLYEKRKQNQRLNLKSKEINDLIDQNRYLNEICLQPVMLPIKPSVRHLLYHGVTQDNPQIDYSTGRQTYLKLRQQLSPNEKYYYPLTTSMDITWHIKQCHYSRSE